MFILADTSRPNGFVSFVSIYRDSAGPFNQFPFKIPSLSAVFSLQSNWFAVESLVFRASLQSAGRNPKQFCFPALPRIRSYSMVASCSDSCSRRLRSVWQMHCFSGLRLSLWNFVETYCTGSLHSNLELEVVCDLRQFFFKVTVLDFLVLFAYQLLTK